LGRNCCVAAANVAAASSNHHHGKEWLPRRLLPQHLHYHELCYRESGDPKQVLEFRQLADDGSTEHGSSASVAEASSTTATVNMLAAPWNPADKLGIVGRYADPFDGGKIAAKENRTTSQGADDDPGCTVPGSEGIGVIAAAAVADNTTTAYEIGDIVVPAIPGLGTYRSSITERMGEQPQKFLKLQRGQQLLEQFDGNAAPVAPLFQLGGTAYRMLKDFIPTQPNDGADSSNNTNSASEKRVILQNAGNSGVGFMSSQIASINFNYETISLVRRGKRTGDAYEEMVHFLTSQGRAAHVLCEDDLIGGKVETLTRFREILAQYRADGYQIPLALNGVGGLSATVLMKALDRGGCMVTYGAMSRREVTVSMPSLIFNDTHLRGFWYSRWMAQHAHDKKQAMAQLLVDGVLDSGLVVPPVQVFPLKDYKEAFEFEQEQAKASTAIRKKIVFDCRGES
jgi:mitochondrial enoyl-[acyl-carrier protein] reductase / trans-2-enoyl-CoA reductase